MVALLLLFSRFSNDVLFVRLSFFGLLLELSIQRIDVRLLLFLLGFQLRNFAILLVYFSLG